MFGSSLFPPDGACRGGQRRPKRPDLLFMLLHCGNADFERGYVWQKWSGWEEWLLPLSVLLGLQERRKLDLDYCTGKTKHTPRKQNRKSRRETIKLVNLLFGWLP